MKKLLSKIKNNGVAMMTVLICITFIAILAASFLYMAYMNYLTKAMRYSSTNNFYTDEFALDELSSTIQQIAAEESSVDDAYEKIRQAVGADATFDDSTKTGNYDPDQLENLIKVMSGDASVSLDIAAVDPANPNYIEETTAITFTGVHLNTTSADGYVSDIVTDIRINFPAKPKGAYDINDFSVISDSYVVGAGKGGSVTFTGCTYMRQKSGATFGFKADSGRLVAFMGDLGLIDGKVIITGNSAVYIAGSMLVNGDVQVDSGSTLVVTGSLTCSGSITGSGMIKGEDNITEGATVELPTDASSNNKSMANEVFASHVYYWGNYQNGGVKYRVTDMNGLAGTGKLPIQAFGDKRMETILGGTSKYKEYKARIGIEDSVHDIKNCLVLDGRDSKLQLKYLLENATVLSLGDVEMPENSTGNMTNLSDSSYVACKKMCLKYSNQLPGDTTSSYLVEPSDLDGDGDGDFDDMKLLLKKKFVNHAAGYSGYKVYSYDASSATVPSDVVSSMTEDQINALTIDSPTRYLIVTDDNKSIIPYGYFISPDATSTISEFFSNVSGDRKPNRTSVAYENWSKE